MRKRIFAALLALTVVFSMFGCAKEDEMLEIVETSATAATEADPNAPAELPGVYVRTVDAEDIVPEFGGTEGQFWEDSRESEEFTVRYYRFPRKMPGVVNDRVFVTNKAVEDPYANWYAQELYEVKDGTLNLLEGKTISQDYLVWGNKLHLEYGVTEYAPGKLRLTWLPEDGVSDFWFKEHEGSQWIMGTTLFRDGKGEEYTFLLDPETGVITDPMDAIPDGTREILQLNLMSGIERAEDGRMLVSPDQREFYYLDTVNGAQYDLNELTNASLEDCAALPDWSEIICWCSGNYWRIPTDTMIPQRLWKLQQEPVYASGIFYGGKATFSVERLQDKRDIPLRVYDYVNNVFFYLDGIDPGTEWNAALSSPDGRKLLLRNIEEGKGETIQFQIFDCDTGELTNLHRTNSQWEEISAGWTEEGQIYVLSKDQTKCCVYTLKQEQTLSFELPEELQQEHAQREEERARAFTQEETETVTALAEEFAKAYLSGNVEGMKACIMGNNWTPPVYSGNQEWAQIYSIDVYESPEGMDGEYCGAFVTFYSGMEKDRHLYLGMRKTGGGWKIENLTEG